MVIILRIYSLRLEAEAQETVIADGACWWSWDGDGVDWELEQISQETWDLRMEPNEQKLKSQWCGVWVAASTSLSAASGWWPGVAESQSAEMGKVQMGREMNLYL